MPDSHSPDSYTEPEGDSPSYDLQNGGQKPLGLNGEEPKMDLDNTLAEELSLEEHLELNMEESEFEPSIKLEDAQFKRESNLLDLKMEGNYSEPVLKDESFKVEDKEPTLKRDSEHDLKFENLEDFKPSDEPEDLNILNQEERDIVGLFEDSDEHENHDSKSKSSPLLTTQDHLEHNLEQERVKEPLDKQIETFEEKEIIHTTLNLVPKPQASERLAICRFPPTLTVLPQNDVRNFLKSNPQLLDHPPNTNTLSMLCFRQITIGSGTNTQASSVSNLRPNSEYYRKSTELTHTHHFTNSSSTSSTHNSDSADNCDQLKSGVENFNTNVNSSTNSKMWDSNGKLVVWEDGNISMFVGKVPLDCESVKEVSFLLEDGRADIKPVHAQVHMRLQTRFSNLHTRFSNLRNDPIKKKKHKRQKMEVASLSDAIESHHALQQNLMNIREHERQKKVHYSSKGLTRSFLESSDNEDGL